MTTVNITKDQLKSLMRGYLAEWSSLDASMDSCAETNEPSFMEISDALNVM